LRIRDHVKSTTSFALGLTAGLALAATTTFAAATGLLPWNRTALDNANRIFGDRSGLSFTVNPPDPDVNPPDPDKLAVHAVPVDGLKQVIAVSTVAPQPGFPPDPCFRAVLVNPPDPDRSNVVLHVLHADQFSIVDATGAPLTLVPADPSTVGTGK
jgi:hypothetical protein